MVRIQDPRADRSAIAMRNLRAMNAYKYIKKTKNKRFNEDKLKLEKTDIDFYDEFKNSSIEIKQELIFLWEEVGNLLDYIEENEKNDTVIENKEKDNITLNLDNIKNDNVKISILENTHNVGPPGPPGPPISQIPEIPSLVRNETVLHNYTSTPTRRYIFGP
jgi:hypothetical protein